MSEYKVRHKSDSVGAGCWDKDTFEAAVFGPCASFVHGEIKALFLKMEDAAIFASKMNDIHRRSDFKLAIQCMRTPEIERFLAAEKLDETATEIVRSVLATRKEAASVRKDPRDARYVPGLGRWPEGGMG